MAAPSYGRNITAQKGKSADYSYGAREAASYLAPDMQQAYESNKKYLATSMQGDKMGYKQAMPEIQHREQAVESINRLRDIAGVNALGQFQQFASGFSKPWKAHTTDEGFLSEDEIKFGGGTDLKDTGKKMDRAEGSDKSWTERYNALKIGTKPSTPDAAFSYGTENWNQDSREALKQKFQAMRRGEGPDNEVTQNTAKNGRPIKGAKGIKYNNTFFGSSGPQGLGPGAYMSPFQQRVQGAYLSGGIGAAQDYIKQNPELAYAGI